MKNKFLIQIFLFFYFTSFSQDMRIPFRNKNLWGYANEAGKIIITPKYDSVNIYDETSRWRVFKNKKVGMINSTGYEFIPVEYDRIEYDAKNSENGNFYVLKGKNEGYLDFNGVQILPTKFENIEECSGSDNEENYIFMIKDKNSFYLIDKNEKKYLDKVQAYTNLHNTNFRIEIGEKFGIYNMLQKRWIIKPIYDSIVWIENSKVINNTIKLKNSSFDSYKYYGQINKKTILFDENWNVHDDNITIEKLYTNSQSETHNDIYESIDTSVKFKNIDSLFTSNSSEIKIEPNFDRNHITVIKEKNKYYLKSNYYDVDEKIKNIGFNKILLDGYYNRFLLIGKNNKYGLYDIAQKKLIIDVKYDDINFNDKGEQINKDNNIVIIKKGKKTGVLMINKNIFIEPFYDEYVSYYNISNIDPKNGIHNSGDNNYLVFLFKKEGKYCYVGEDKTVFYKD